ncbi:transposase InsO family protein [Marmoricola sp. URHA0025 HA25]
MKLDVQPVTQEGRRFYDGGLDADSHHAAEPPDPGSDPQIVLVRVDEHAHEQFAMQRRIAYRDRHLGELLVPRVTGTFRSDLTSVPALFTWLVPKTGQHLPATLLHDGLIHPPGDVTYVSTDGHVVLRAEADRVLRDAMADAGTALIRRWLMWSAVTTATMLSGAGTGWSRGLAWRYRATAAVTVLLVAVLGFCATLDLLDVHVTGVPQLPWMGDRGWFAELAGGLSGAVVIPLFLSLFWGRFRIAGAVVGVTLAVLLHVTVALLTLSAAYRVLEWLTARVPALMLALVGVVTAVTVVVFVGLML